MSNLEKYNEQNPIISVHMRTLGIDTYKLEVRRDSYNVIINGRPDKVYTRLPKELRSWFGL